VLDFKQSPHRRFNPLTREWLLVSPHRTQRPWQGQVEKTPVPPTQQYDPGCYLCPGNTRAGGHTNPRYSSTFVFDNDYAALLPESAGEAVNEGDLLVAAPERGVCRVVCFSPDHSLTLSRMKPAEIRPVVDTWAEQYLDLGGRDFIRYVQIFENRGEVMGASNPHPHGQIWASESIPNESAKERAALADYQARHGSCLLCDYLTLEQKNGERLVLENDSFVVVVPFWAVWPFEVLLLSKRHVSSVDALDSKERDGLAEALHRIGARYDNVFSVSFPYTMGFHQAATDGRVDPHAHFHAHYYPPLLRSATVRKFMVGYEMLGTPQRDITPESAAERLRQCSETPL
jgi:UDPglucose--hexose-1-phosphate uridylyltransferase